MTGKALRSAVCLVGVLVLSLLLLVNPSFAQDGSQSAFPYYDVPEMSSQLGENSTVLTDVGDEVQPATDSCSRVEAMLQEALPAIGDRFQAIDDSLAAMDDRLSAMNGNLPVKATLATHWMSPVWENLDLLWLTGKDDQIRVEFKADTAIRVLNAGASDVHVEITYYDGYATVIERLTANIPPRSIRVFNSKALYSDLDGWVEIKATGPILPSGHVNHTHDEQYCNANGGSCRYGSWRYGSESQSAYNMTWYPVSTRPFEPAGSGYDALPTP